MPRRKTIEDFLREAKLNYGDKYDYSKVNYINTSTKVIIICPDHGEFLKTPYHFLIRKQECRECSGYTNWNWELFVKKATEFQIFK
jgi:hypothetical protein